MYEISKLYIYPFEWHLLKIASSKCVSLLYLLLLRIDYGDGCGIAG